LPIVTSRAAGQGLECPRITLAENFPQEDKFLPRRKDMRSEAGPVTAGDSHAGQTSLSSSSYGIQTSTNRGEGVYLRQGKRASPGNRYLWGYHHPTSRAPCLIREETSHQWLPKPSFIEPEIPATVSAKEAPQMERVKEVLHQSLHFLESPRSSNGGNTVFVAVPKVSNRPLITAIRAAREVKITILDGRYDVIVNQHFLTLCTRLIHHVNALRVAMVTVFTERSSCAEP
jgi:hypothetical protein